MTQQLLPVTQDRADTLSGGKPILCVDDDAIHLKVLKSFFSKQGFRVLTTTDGRDGLSLLVTETPCLVLLDLKMPEFSGLQFLAQMRNIPKLRGVPVIIQSAYAVREILDKAMPYGIYGAIAKPFDIRSLNKIVIDVLSKSDHTEDERHPLQVDRPDPSEAPPPAPPSTSPMTASDCESLNDELDSLRVLPHTLAALREIADSSQSGVNDVVEVIRNDCLMTASVMRSASLVQGRGKVKTIEDAITNLGFDQIAKLAKRLESLALLDAKTRPGRFSVFNHWKHSMVVGLTAQKLAELIGLCDPAEALLAGLLHDVSIGLMAQCRPAFLEELAKVRSSSPLEFDHAATDKMGFGFPEISRVLLERWGLASHISLSAGHHLDAHDSIMTMEDAAKNMTLLIKAADLLAHATLTDPLQNFPILDGSETFNTLLHDTRIQTHELNDLVSEVLKEVDELAEEVFEGQCSGVKPQHRLERVAIVRPPSVKASPLNLFLNVVVGKAIEYKAADVLENQAWDAIYIDAAHSGVRFAARILMQYSTRTDLHDYPAFCLVTPEMMETFKKQYISIPIKFVELPCWAQHLMPPSK